MADDLTERARAAIIEHERTGESLEFCIRKQICRAWNDGMVAATGGITIRDPDGDLDEIIAHQANVHIERMAEDDWWIGLDAGGKRYMLSFTTPLAPINLSLREDGVNGQRWESKP